MEWTTSLALHYTKTSHPRCLCASTRFVRMCVKSVSCRYKTTAMTTWDRKCSFSGLWPVSPLLSRYKSTFFSSLSPPQCALLPKSNKTKRIDVLDCGVYSPSEKKRSFGYDRLSHEDLRLMLRRSSKHSIKPTPLLDFSHYCTLPRLVGLKWNQLGPMVSRLLLKQWNQRLMILLSFKIARCSLHFLSLQLSCGIKSTSCSLSSSQIPHTILSI